MITLPCRNDDWESLARRIEAADGPIMWAYLATRTSAPDKWLVQMLTIRGVLSGEARASTYQNLLISTTALSPVQAAAMFRSGLVGFSPDRQEIRIEPTAGEIHGTWLCSDHPPYTRAAAAWPQFYAANVDISRDRSSTQVSGLLDPLIGLTEPYYPTLAGAIAEILFGVRPEALGTDASPGATVMLPDLRARIRPLRFRDGATLVEVEEGKSGGCHGALVRATWRASPDTSTYQRHETMLNGPGVTGIDTGGVPAEMSVVVCASDGQPLDQRGWTTTYGERPIDEALPAERVMRLLLEGEHEQLEYKQELGPRESTHRSLAETVAAFANGRGGVVLLGVSDDGIPVGCGSDSAVTRDQVANIVRTMVSGAPQLTMNMVRVDDRPILVIEVAPGDDAERPYMCGERVMIRTLGTTRAANPYQIRQLLISRPLTRWMG